MVRTFPSLNVAVGSVVAMALACSPSVVATPSAPIAAPSASSAQQQLLPIHYRVETRGEPGGEKLSVLADRAGSTFRVFAGEFTCCLSIMVEGDLDGDGLADALIEEGTGGAAGKFIYFFAPGTLSDGFSVQELGYGAGEVETWRGRSSLLLYTDNEGVNTDRPEQGTRRFAFERGRAVVVEEKHAVEVKAVVDLRSEQFDASYDRDEEKALRFDLDGDGKQDEVIGRLWFRWGRFHWRVRFGDGRVTEEDDSSVCKRLGVLPEKTAGHNDLVCDFDTRFRWNGHAYEAVVPKVR